jgi:hypothetical protein
MINLDEITTFFKSRAAVEKIAGYPQQSKIITYGLELSATLEAVTTELDMIASLLTEAGIDEQDYDGNALLVSERLRLLIDGKSAAEEWIALNRF